MNISPSFLRSVVATATLIFVGLTLGSLSLTSPAAIAATGDTATCKPLLDHRFPRLQDEAEQSLCQYAGKVVVVVNTASYCGFTSQYKALEALYAERQKDGLVVLGFPSNDFGSQEPGSNKQIAEFCSNTFGVKFPMFAKTQVSKGKANPFYTQLASKTGSTPKWNFHKYVIGRDGETVASFGSTTEPGDKQFVAEINKLLSAK
jgi:glutathione peroxidase